MSESKISTRYASSFLELSIEKNILEQTSSDMELIRDAFISSRELRLAIDNPVVKSEIKEVILLEIFSDKLDPETNNFIKFVLKKGRESLLLSIAQKFLELRNEHLGIVQADITSAFELSDQQKQEIKERFELTLNKKVKFSYNIDKNLLGGFIAKVGDTVYDASVKHQLNLLKNHFIKVDLSLN